MATFLVLDKKILKNIASEEEMKHIENVVKKYKELTGKRSYIVKEIDQVEE